LKYITFFKRLPSNQQFFCVFIHIKTYRSASAMAARQHRRRLEAVDTHKGPPVPANSSGTQDRHTPNSKIHKL
jgi:hypothetical protein